MELQRIKDLLKQATPGPWRAGRGSGIHVAIFAHGHMPVATTANSNRSVFPERRHINAELIALLRNSAEEMLEQLEGAETAAKEFEKLWHDAEARCTSLDAELETVKDELSKCRRGPRFSVDKSTCQSCVCLNCDFRDTDQCSFGPGTCDNCEEGTYCGVCPWQPDTEE